MDKFLTLGKIMIYSPKREVKSMSKAIRQLFLFGISILLLNLPFVATAGVVGNTASPDTPKGPGVFTMKQQRNLAIKTAVDMEFLTGRDLHASDATKTEILNGHAYSGKISFVAFDRIEPYFRLGIAQMKAKWTEAGTEVKLESDDNFAWGVGGKVLIWNFEKPKIKLVGDGSYRIADLDVDKAAIAGQAVSFDTAKSRFLIREWQVALLAATEIDVGTGGKEEVLGISTLVPYAGVKYSQMYGRLRLVRSDATFFNPGVVEADHNIGIFAGCDFVGPNSVSLNIEGRFLDETAFSAGLIVLF